MSRILLAFSVVTSLPATVLAHPGHGHTDATSLAHYAFEPMHWLPMLGLLLGVGAGLLLAYWKRSR